MRVPKTRTSLLVAVCAALAGCSASSQTQALEQSPISGSGPAEAAETTDGLIPSTSTITSVYDVRVNYAFRFGSGFPLPRWYPSFAYYYPYLSVAFRSYGAWGADFVHPRYGWQPQPGIGYINNEGTRYPATIDVRGPRDLRPTAIDGIDEYSVGRSTWSVGSR
jgi:hypothetical protein